MTDPMIDPQLDLSIATLRRLCQGDPKRLPSFVVHDDTAWPWHASVRPAKGKIHLRRTTFNRVVATQVPVRPGLWIRPDAQEFFIALTVADLQGSSDPAAQDPSARNHSAARGVAKADEAGRLPDEADYGTPVVERPDGGGVDRDDLARIARDPEKRGVASSVLLGGDTEGTVAESDHDRRKVDRRGGGDP